MMPINGLGIAVNVGARHINGMEGDAQRLLDVIPMSIITISGRMVLILCLIVKLSAFNAMEKNAPMVVISLNCLSFVPKYY